MRTHGEHIRILRRRVDFLKARDHKNGYDQAELGALEWALVNLPPQSSKPWVGLTNNELQPIANEYRILFGSWVEDFARAIEAKLREKNS